MRWNSWLARLFGPRPEVQPFPCRFCQPSELPPGDNPFRITQPIVYGYHQNVILAACRHCHAPALQYSVDIFDDYWAFWCPIDEAEKAKILSIEEGDRYEDTVIAMTLSILRERRILQKHPLAGLTWKDGKSCMLEGPPW